MQTFKDYMLVEKVTKDWESSEATIEETVNFLNSHCKDGLKALTTNGVLYRGFGENFSKSPRIIDSSTGERTSKDTNNLYQLMMDTSTALKQYPSRSKSFICTTRLSTASAFSADGSQSEADGRHDSICVMIPINGTKVAICKEGDIFNNRIESKYIGLFFPPTYSSAVGANLDNAGYKYPSSGKFTDASDIDRFLSKLSSEEAAKIMVGNKSGSIEQLQELFDANVNHRFTFASSKIMTPTSLGLTLEDYGNNLPRDKECWFSGKAVAIPVKIFAQVLKQIIQDYDTKKSSVQVSDDLIDVFADMMYG